MVSWLHVQIEQKWNSWLDKTTSYKFIFHQTNRSVSLEMRKHLWNIVDITQPYKLLESVSTDLSPKFYQSFTEKYLCSDEGHFWHFLPFTWKLGSKIFFTGNLPMAKLSEKHFSNFWTKKLFLNRLSLSQPWLLQWKTGDDSTV